MKKYEKVIIQIRQQIENKVWHVGDKLPSLRTQADLSGISLMTVLNAYQTLESQGWLVSHPRSGYFVAPQIHYSESKVPGAEVLQSEEVDINDFIFDVLQASRIPNIVGFGSVYPDPTLYPRAQINKSLMSAASSMPVSSLLDNLPPGNGHLRHIIAQRYAAMGMNIPEQEIVITAGALEALNLSLQAITKPGDWVVIESPTFYCALQSLQRNNLRALSVRTHPQTGIDLEALEKAFQSHPVKACWLMTNHQNPLGSSMSAEKKQELIELLTKYQVYLIEDDVYNELYFSGRKPLPAKAFDPRGMTLHCSSFSKSLVAGYRIGWVAGGKKALAIQKLQLMSTLSTSAPIQLALANYLTSRHYESHLKQLRRKLEQRKFAMWQALRNEFPAYVNINYSEGGYFLWVELPENIDTTTLYHRALENKISIAPGAMFSANKQFDHCFRLNASLECTEPICKAIKCLASLIKSMVKE